MNLSSLTPAERGVVVFTLACALTGGLVLAMRSQRPTPIAQEKSKMEAREIRERLVKTDHASAPRNRTGVAIDLNAASEKDLSRLPAMGPGLAHLVAQDRAAHGPFASVSDLARVKGINAQRLKNLSAFLYVMPSSGIASAAPVSASHP